MHAQKRYVAYLLLGPNLGGRAQFALYVYRYKTRPANSPWAKFYFRIRVQGAWVTISAPTDWGWTNSPKVKASVQGLSQTDWNQIKKVLKSYIQCNSDYRCFYVDGAGATSRQTWQKIRARRTQRGMLANQLGSYDAADYVLDLAERTARGETTIDYRPAEMIPEDFYTTC